MCSKGEQKHDDNLEIVFFVAAMDHVGMLSSFRQVWNFNDDVGLEFWLLRTKINAQSFL